VWFKALPGSDLDGVAWPGHDKPNTRREAEDAAARAFARLSPKRRAGLLAPPGTADEQKPGGKKKQPRG
jgi:hypothetical protein